ncbi:CHAT domain protein [Caballeronia choica]|uniref:CHAT domain protein n=2 Tax=Caballeronia choica TaxID=326476 RepID=A0A158KH63_9BURK|nr:CHAT domain protein [Caballeronia choica]
MADHLSDWARSALSGVDASYGENSRLDLIQLAVSKLAECIASEASDCVADLIAYCGAALKGPFNVDKQGAWKLLEVRGAAYARVFEQSGDMVALRSSVDDLTSALDGAPVDQRADISVSLALALFRVGEQSGDVEILRKSEGILDSGAPGLIDQPRVGSARALIKMTIGTTTGDRQLVERAVLDLQKLILLPDIDDDTRAHLHQNLAIALLRNAGQNRSARVYSKLLDNLALALKSKPRTHHAEMLRIVQVMARFEYAKLSNDARQLRRTELELARLLGVFAHLPRRRLELLHLLGQTQFNRGNSKDSSKLVESAIRHLRDALLLCPAGEGKPDARRDRILADLGYYSLHVALLTGSHERAGEAEQYFQTALHSITIERAPGLYIQVAKGLFELHYRGNALADAAAAAEDINRAAHYARSDPRLTAGVLFQAPLEILGIPERHALCLTRLGRLAEAGAALDNARGQHLAAALERRAETDGMLSANALAEIGSTRSCLTQALRRTHDTQVRRAWEDYLESRRKHGLDLGSKPRLAQSIADAAPMNGALVQLSFTASGSMALVWTRLSTSPILVQLPQTAWQSIRRLIYGDDDKSSWLSAYERFLQASVTSGESMQAGILEWSRVIEDGLSTLWNVVFKPIRDALLELHLEPGAPLLICPPGQLALLPLSAAFNEAGDSVQWDVSIVPNTLAVRSVEPARNNVRSMVCLHSPAGGAPSFLPFTREEATALRRLEPDLDELCDEDLTALNALNAMHESTHVHVCCHGAYDPDDAAQSGLMLAHGERLTLTRLWAAGFDHFPVRLVFLSCCEGGMTGRSLDSDEFMGLPAAFLQLGAVAVIAAQWTVFDDAARVFADAFYRHYLGAFNTQPVSPARALAETRRWIRTVTVGTLIQEQFLSDEQARELFVSPTPRSRRLRTFQGDFPGENNTKSAGGDAVLNLNLRPYADACHWAAWMLFGQ